MFICQKIQYIDFEQSQNFDEEDEDQIIGSYKSLSRSPNENKIFSWNQIGEFNNPRKKSFQQHNRNNEDGMREKKESLSLNPREKKESIGFNPREKKESIGFNPRKKSYQQNRIQEENIRDKKVSIAQYNNRKKSRTSIQNTPNIRSRNISKVEKEMNQDQKYNINIINTKENKKEPFTNNTKVSLLDEDFTDQTNYDSHMTIGELLNKKKRRLVPSFFDNKKFIQNQQKKDFQINNQLINQTNENKMPLMMKNQIDSYSKPSQYLNQRFKELNELHYKEDNLRNKSTITLSSDSSSDNSSSDSSKCNKKTSQISNNLINQFSNQNDENKKNANSEIKNSYEQIKQVSQKDIVNKLLNGGSMEEIEEQRGNINHQDFKKNQSLSESQKIKLLLGAQNNDDQLINELIGFQQESLQNIQNPSNKLIDEENNKNTLEESNKRQSLYSDPTLKIQQISEKSIREKKKSTFDYRRSQLSVVDQNGYQNNQQSFTSLSGKVQKKSILSPFAVKQPNQSFFSSSNIQNLNMLANLASQQQALQQQKISPNNSNIVIPTTLKNIGMSDIHKKMYGSVNANNVRKKVSILVTRNGTQDVPINVTLSVNQQEQDQLREIFELESKLMHGSMLKKTLPRKMSSRLRSKSNELLETPYKKQIDEKSEQKQNEDETKKKKQKGYVFNIPSLNNIDNASYQLKYDNQSSQSQLANSYQDDYLEESYQYADIDQLELRKYEQIFLKKYDDEFISQFEKAKEYKEYFPKNNFSNVLEMISIRRKLNPFYRELLLRKRVKNQSRPQNRLTLYKKSIKNLNLMSMYGSSFLKQSFSVNTVKNHSPSNFH